MDGGNKSSMPDLSGIINLISQNPSLISSIASMLGSQGQGHKPPPCEPPPCEPPPPPPDSCCDATPLPVPCQRYSKEIALLEALKPFLDHRRCQTIDMIIKLSGLFELFKGR